MRGTDEDSDEIRAERDALARRLRVADALARIRSQLRFNYDLDAVLASVCRHLCGEAGVERAIVLLDDREEGMFTVQASCGYPDDGSARALSALRIYRSDPGAAVLASGTTLLYEGGAPAELHALGAGLHLGTFAAAPLRDVSGGTVGFLVAGVVGTAVTARGGLTDEFVDSLSEIADEVSAAISACIVYRRLEQERSMLESQQSELVNVFHELEKANAIIREDLEQAQAFQRLILAVPPRIPGMEVEILYRPVDMVGGDLYDVSIIGDSLVRLFLADATGHGVKASLTTMFIRSEYEHTKRDCAEPCDVLAALDQRIGRTYDIGDMRFTALCVDIDLRTGALAYASAAHPPPCLLRADHVTELESGGSFMGLAAADTFPQWRMSLLPKDALFLFTDGIAEASNVRGEMFGEERLYAAMSEAEASRKPIAPFIWARVERFLGARAAPDDITIVGVRRA